LSLATILVATSVATPVRAAQPAGTTAPTPVSDAKQSFAAGLARYEAGDYAGAIAAWTSARAQMATDPQARDAWHVLGLDLAQAHVRAYRLDRDLGHFDPAQQLLDAYVEWVDRPGHTMDDAEREDRPRALEMLAFIERERAARTAATAPTPAPVVEPSKPAAPPMPRNDSEGRESRLRASHALIGSGVVALGLGLGSIVAVGVLVPRGARTERDFEMLQAEIGNDPPTPEQQAQRDEINRRGIAVNTGVIAAGTCAAVFLAAGIGLLSGGLVVRKRALRAAPSVGPGYAGASMSLRF
jgi:hypothetical protein